MNIRVKYEKVGTMRYVGHLDVMRYFQKAIKRANIDIAYTEGFSPHQIMSFASPLGVGVMSLGDYFDITVNSSESSAKSIAALNKQMTDGLKVTGWKLLPEKCENAMASVAAADYVMTGKNPFTSLFSLGRMQDELVRWFDNTSEIIVQKKTKKSVVEVDLKKLVRTFEITNENGCPRFGLFIAQGSEASIKPDFIVEKFYENMGMRFDIIEFEIMRNDLFTVIDGEYVSLGEIGEDIV